MVKNKILLGIIGTAVRLRSGSVFADQLAHLLSGCKFDCLASGNDDRYASIFRIAANFLLSFHDFEYSKIAKFKAVTLRKKLRHGVEKGLHYISHIVGMDASLLRDNLNQLLFCDRGHNVTPINSCL